MSSSTKFTDTLPSQTDHHNVRCVCCITQSQWFIPQVLCFSDYKSYEHMIYSLFFGQGGFFLMSPNIIYGKVIQDIVSMITKRQFHSQ